MGFRPGAYATVWEVTPLTSTMTKARVSTSRKDKATEQYVQDFGGFIVFIGTAAAAKAAKLQPQDRIKLGDVEVTNKYDKEKGKEYTDFKVFSFEAAGEQSGGETPRKQDEPASSSVDDGEIETDDLPF